MNLSMSVPKIECVRLSIQANDFHMTHEFQAIPIGSNVSSVINFLASP